ncbi:MAG TPA: putative toxin-antitoxin system toxin component, PIN family [Candidatus Binatia bacterium]|nr:putative toxin-antitoxin system toxin component, PIN family [Candidatus Binatia bacterium]
MKIVIDTNTLINASSDDNNYGNRIVEEVLKGSIEAYANPQTLGENILIASKKITDQQYLEKLLNYFDTVKQVEGQRIHVVEDPEDNKILASAVAAGVDYLITSDWHLLKIAEYGGVKIVSPQGFWAEYESETGKGWQDWLNKFVN